ncbi:MAG: hypothetical protein EXR71_03460 [Myxococcales bacterium]|nr:hypothetical protein [Myxococcales bacterium]
MLPLQPVRLGEHRPTLVTPDAPELDIEPEQVNMAPLVVDLTDAAYDRHRGPGSVHARRRRARSCFGR